MAENLETTTTVETEPTATETVENKTPTVEELLTKIAQKDADYAKLKNAFDSKASALSKTEKQLKAKMTAEEQEQEAKKEADEAKDARIQELESEFRKMNYSKRYMGIGMDEKTAEIFAEITGDLPDTDKFFSELDKFIKGKVKSAGENAVQELIKNNPEIKAGSGSVDPNAWVGDMAKDIAGQKNKANKSIIERYV